MKYYSMSITVLVGLFFSIIATKLMMTLENRQSIMFISGLYNVPADLIVSDTIITHRLTLMKLTIRTLYRVSMAIFYLQGLHPEISFPPVTSHSNNK